MAWFEQLFGFAEADYASATSRFRLDATRLTSLANGRTFEAGSFSTPSLAELRRRSQGLRPGTLRVTHEAIGDVLELHAAHEGAMFQVASQLNCLEFAGPDEVPEDGITQYDDDPTQGPACALAAAAATVVRNYFAEVDGKRGQRRDRQLNNLADLMAMLGEPYVDVVNGYTFSDAARLQRVAGAIARHDREALMGQLRIGVQTGVEVTFATRFVEPTTQPFVSQAFCSALSCGYNGGGKALWAPLATLVLEGAYEATLRAAVIDASEGDGSGVVWLTFLGGGAFGNEPAWIGGAIARALGVMRGHDLNVRIGHYRRLDGAMQRAIATGGAPG